MRKIPAALFIMLPVIAWSQNPSGKDILDHIDRNMSSDNRIIVSKMIIYGARGSRTIESRIRAVGDRQAFTEYLSPAREAGTKMLKIEDQLWIYSPSKDRTIQISGHMLRQSVMGSDLSYEDMMENSKLTDDYDAVVTGEEFLEDRKCWILELKARSEEVAYQVRKIWVDRERYLPLQEELYAKSGKLLKKTGLKDFKQKDQHWYPEKIIFRDMLGQGNGTEFIIQSIDFNADIPVHIFTKASLR